MDTVQLLQAQLQQLNDIQTLIYYCALGLSAFMGFGKGASL